MNKIYSLIIFCILCSPTWLMAASTAQGKQIYSQNCSICHGTQGISNMPSAPNFKRGETLFQSDLTLLEHIKKGKNACPAFVGILKKQQMLDVIAYLRTFYQ